jgi:hypothetical protein
VLAQVADKFRSPLISKLAVSSPDGYNLVHGLLVIPKFGTNPADPMTIKVLTVSSSRLAFALASSLFFALTGALVETESLF